MTLIRALFVSTLVWLMAVLPAKADYLVNQGTQTPIAAGVIGGTNRVLSWEQIVDGTGTPLGTQSNPLYFNYSTGTLLPAFAAPPTIAGFSTPPEVRLFDSISGQLGTIKAPNVPTTAADTALVVDIRNIPAISSSVTQATIPWVVNNYQLANVNLGPPSPFGTPPVGNVQGVNAFVTNGFTTGPAAIANTLATNFLSQYPVNSVTVTPTPKGSVQTGTTGAVTAALGAVASVTNYLCGFDVSYVGGTASGQVTVTGLLMGTLTYNILASATPGLLPVRFNPCVPASAVNTAITLTSPALSGASADDINLWGYSL